MSQAEFEAQFTACSTTLWCIAAGVLGDRILAEDVVQEAAMIALQKLDQFDPSGGGPNFVAWLGQFVRFVALNTARKQLRSATLARDPVDIDRGIGISADGFRTSLGGLKADVGPATTMSHSPVNQRGELVPDQQAFDDQVLTGLRSLAAVARACLLLRTVCDLPYREIALALDLPEGTVMSHVHRARKHLRQCVGSPHEDGRRQRAEAMPEAAPSGTERKL